MGINILEIKAVLRSILISSTVVINVAELNRDFEELMGIGIPYKDLAFDSLLGFLKSIPDVLLVEGNSNYSRVYLVESEKSAHVSDLVLKQKSSKKPGSFYGTKDKFGRRRGSHTQIFKKNSFQPATPSKKESQNKKPSETVPAKQNNEQSSNTSCDKNNKSISFGTNENIFEQRNHQSEVIINTPEKNSLSIDIENSEQRLNCENKNERNLENSSNNEIKESNESTKLLRRINYKTDSFCEVDFLKVDDSINESHCLNLDVSLKTSATQKNTNYWRGGTTSLSRHTKNTDELTYEEETFRNCVKYTESSSGMASSVKTKHYGNNSNSWPCKNSYQKKKTEKCKSQNIRSRTNNSCNSKLQQAQKFIPKALQNNLHKLITSFPEGLWCSELPTVYINLVGQDLDFEKYGYRCLSHLCFDLENIFHCVRESSCDYKIYDARKPPPEIKIISQQSSPIQITQDSSPIELPPAVPEITWDSYDCFLPEGAVKLGYELQRIQVADIFQVGTNINVVVAEIYDISKFWIYLDDSKLDRLMNEMQVFYEINKKYILPKSLLAEGLYCVVLYHSKFHRAVILNVMPDEEYIKVYYFDYGTLGMVSKSEVWFMTQGFIELPSQAIRARLVDVYPPYEGVTWSPFANYDFSKLTCMKKLTAEIIRIDKHKNMVEVKLKNSYGTSISDILVEEKHALFINKTPRKHIDDPNCESRVRFIHLFPTFEEIENWVVPSMEEAANFLNTPVTADFLFSQYFSRKVDMNLIDSIEEKMKVISRKKKVLIKFTRSEELEFLDSMEEMNRIAYGQLYDTSITETEGENDVEYKSIEEVQKEVDSKNNSWVYMEDDETFARILRQNRMKKVGSFKADMDISGSSLKVEDSSWQKSKNRAPRELPTFSELEKYLSEDSPQNASKKSTPDLIDLDNMFPTSLDSSTNLLQCSDFEQSMSDLAKSRKKCEVCLLTESLVSDSENCMRVNPLDLPIPISIKNYNHTSSDLIQFDEEESMQEKTCGSVLTEGIHSINTKPIFNIGSEELSDADDEDSDSKQNFTHYINDSFRSKVYKKKVQYDSTETNTAFEFNSYDVSDNSIIGATTNQTIQKAPEILNNSESTHSSNINEHECAISNDTLENESIVSNLNVTNIGIKFSSPVSNTTSFSSNSIVTIDSVEFYNMESLEKPSGRAAIDTDFCSENEHNNIADFNSLDQKLAGGNSAMKNIVNCGTTTGEPSEIPGPVNCSNKSIHSIHSKEFGNRECLGLSCPMPIPDLRTNVDDLVNLKDDGNMNLHDSSSSTNLYYSCESKESSIPDSCSEDSLDLAKFKIYIDGDTMGVSTPLPTERSDSHKDSSFLEEFDIIDISPTISSNSHERNEVVTSSLSVLSGEFMSLEVSTSQLDTDEGTSSVSQSIVSKNLVEGDEADMDLEKTMCSSLEVIEESHLCSMKESESTSLPNSSTLTIVDDPPETPLSSNSPAFQMPDIQFSYIPNYTNHPQSLLTEPPPGFPPIPPLGFPPSPPPGFSPYPTHSFTTVLVPNSIQYPNRFIPPNIPMSCIAPQHLEMLNGMAQYYRTQPIVVLNYNFLPPQNQNGKS